MPTPPHLVPKCGMASGFVASTSMAVVVQELEGHYACVVKAEKSGSSMQKKRSQHDKTITMIQKTKMARYAAENGSLWKHSA